MTAGRPPSATPAEPKGRSNHLPALDDPVQYLPGVGPRRAEWLAELSIRTVGDLIEFFPFRHVVTQPTLIRHLDVGASAEIVGQVVGVRRGHYGYGPSVVLTVQDNTGVCRACWFNAPYISQRVAAGMVVRLAGKVSAFDGLPQLVNPRLEALPADAPPVRESDPPRIEPIYHATQRVSSGAIARLIADQLDRLAPQLAEWHPDAFLSTHGFPLRAAAVVQLHRPNELAQVEAARRRLAFDELLVMQLIVKLSRRRRSSGPAALSIRVTPEIDGRIRARLPYALTGGQNAAVADIVADLAREQAMQRLVQGDVGCGKTLVAVYAALAAIAARTQAALMAPTEILARQLFDHVRRYLEGSRVRAALLTGGAPKRERAALLADAKAGRLDLLVGTHALIEADVEFARLGLVIVDEQHRFGVRQRATIRRKGPAPHCLLMTATPIPRTLAMTVFGDLDVTTLHDRPPGRLPVETRLVAPEQADAAWQLVRARVAAGEQAYIVCPLIEDAAGLPLRSATTEFRRLRDGPLRDIPLGLLHGRMKPAEREQVMADFSGGRVAALVSTTVIEVGVDVPRATVIVVQHPTRYGLSQLHQLRGRIGRGGRPGVCLLLLDDAAEAERDRLSVLAETADGFRIAEEDLRIRGPGELLGTRQHGLPELRVANIVGDVELTALAERHAEAMLAADPRLQRPEHREIRAHLVRRFADRLEWAATG